MPADAPDLARFCCQNRRCSLHGARDADNLTVCGRYGKHYHIRLLCCRACKARFSERKGMALFRFHLAPETAVSVLQHPIEGDGTRETGWLVGVHRDTVTRLARMAGARARSAHDFGWPVRTLRERGEGGAWRRRTPATAAGLADHVRSLTGYPVTFPCDSRYLNGIGFLD